MPERTEPDSPRLTLGRSKRLTHAREFGAVHAARLRRSRGPISLSGIPNDLGRTRLGLAIAKSTGKKGSKAGTAIFRNRLKRLLREAFRLEQHALPRGFDFVISARAHDLLPLDDYRRLLIELARDVEAEAARRTRREERKEARDE